MEFFLDTGIIAEIKEAVQLGIIDGVTTNPSLIAKTGRKQEDVIKEISEIGNFTRQSRRACAADGADADQAFDLVKVVFVLQLRRHSVHVA